MTHKIRTAAQKKADRKYAEKVKGKYTHWGTAFSVEEAKKIDETIKESGMSKVEFIRWGVKKLEEGK